MTPDELGKKWSSITYYEGGFLRLDLVHPLEWYVGYQSIEQKTLMIVSSCETIIPFSSKSVIVSNRHRETDGRWTLTFELVKNEQEGVFINLCCDILNYSQSASNEKDALHCVSVRFKQWNRLLELQRKELMDESCKKGLIGELTFIESKLDEGITALSVMLAWVGAEGADQDFTFSDGWYEVKTVGVGATSVAISSLEQLDCSDEGYLVVVRIDKCSPERRGAFSLTQKINDIRNRIHADIEAVEMFETKLAQYGYIDLLEYGSQMYSYSGLKIYVVDDAFPKLVSQRVQPQIIACQYTLALAGISAWER